MALKDGWLPLNSTNTNWQVNSVGWISGSGRDYLMAVLTTGNPTEQYGIDTISQLSTLVWRDRAVHTLRSVFQQVREPDDIPAIGLRRRLGDDQQVVELGVDEVAVAFEIVLVDVEFRGNPEKAFELRDPEDRHVPPPLTDPWSVRPAIGLSPT